MRGSECDIRVLSAGESVHYIHSPNVFLFLWLRSIGSLPSVPGDISAEYNLHLHFGRTPRRSGAGEGDGALGSEWANERTLHFQVVLRFETFAVPRGGNAEIGGNKTPIGYPAEECANESFVGIGTNDTTVLLRVLAERLAKKYQNDILKS